MVKIIFKNVGQGDSIIIERQQDGEKVCSIIDCNKVGDLNPVLDHLKENSIKRIQFALITHPHTDHFSGFLDILQYSLENNIRIDRFLHTAEHSYQYYASILNSIEDQGLLIDIYNKITALRDVGLCEDIYVIESNPDLKIPITDDLYLEVLSPSSIEKNKFANNEDFLNQEEERGNNPTANFLSTMIVMRSKLARDRFFLFSSDCESSVFTRIIKKNGGKLYKKKIVGGQVPHHGSLGNYNKTFWSTLKKSNPTPLAISVGKNAYKHPSAKLIDSLGSLKPYVLMRTDRKSVETKEQVAWLTRSLDSVSKVTHNYSDLKSGDVIMFFNDELDLC